MQVHEPLRLMGVIRVLPTARPSWSLELPSFEGDIKVDIVKTEMLAAQALTHSIWARDSTVHVRRDHSYEDLTGTNQW
jgi:hypothetical protein